MKVYFYYLIDKDIIKRMSDAHLLDSMSNIEEDPDDNYFFYAYTNKKKVAKRFEFMRDPNKFVRKIVNMTDKEYEDLAKRCYGFQEIIDTALLYGEHKHIILPITTSERWFCVENTVESMMEYFSRSPYIPFEIFETEIIHLLAVVGYISMRHPTVNLPGYAEESYYSVSCGWANQLGAFLILYEDLLSYEKVIEGGVYE